MSLQHQKMELSQMPLADDIQAISDTIYSYRLGEVDPLTPEHVERWLSQFDIMSRPILASELRHIFSTYYLSKDKFIELTRSFLSHSSICGNDNGTSFLRRASFMDIQRNGGSQDALLEILQQTINQTHPLARLNINTHSDHYIYLDDFIFSGSRAVNDITAAILEQELNNCRITLVQYGYYLAGQWQIGQRLSNVLRPRNITIDYLQYNPYKLENRLRYKNNSDVLWPTTNLTDPAVTDYIRQKCSQQEYRGLPGSNRVFSSDANRQLLESEFTSKGVAILSNYLNPSPVLRPLGFSTFRTLGFGSMLFTYRNCPNNTPLCFWWGNRDRLGEFGEWYPLFERATYE